MIKNPTGLLKYWMMRGTLHIVRQDGRVIYRGLHNVLVRVETIQAILDAVVEGAHRDEVPHRLYECGRRVGQGFGTNFSAQEMYPRQLRKLTKRVLKLWDQYDREAGFAAYDFALFDANSLSGTILARNSFLSWARNADSAELCPFLAGYISACLSKFSEQFVEATSECPADPRFHRECRFKITTIQLKTATATTSYVLGGLRTILFTDIEDSTALTQAVGDTKAQELVNVHNNIVRTALSTNGGMEVKHTGDGIMAAFTSASEALKCALTVQENVARHNATHPETMFRVRVGLNAGEPIAAEDDLLGTAVQLAARICSAASPGEVLVSNVVRELAMGKGYAFEQIPPTELKGFAEPIQLHRLTGQTP